jgi:gas vesicle protein
VSKAHDAAVEGALKCLHRGSNLPVSSSGRNGGIKGSPKTTSELAGELKISRETFDRAAKLHKVFAEETKPLKWDKDTLRKLHLSTKKKWTIRQVFEPQILDRLKPMGLGAAVAGISSVIQADRQGKKPGGKPKDSEKQLRLFTDTFKDLSTRFEYWQNFDDSTKSEARKEIRASFEQMPEDLLKTLSAEVRAEMQRRKSEDA